MKKFALVVFVLWSITLTACGKASVSEPATATDNATPNEVVLSANAQGVIVIAVQPVPIPDYLEIPARAQPDPRLVIRVFPPIGGRLVTMEVKPGDRVRAGQTVAVLESSDVSSARVDYEKARSDAELKEKTLKRAALLFENKVFAEKDYQQAVTDAEMARSELNRTRDRLRVLRIDPQGTSNRFVVAAPRAGVVLDIGAAQGEFSKSLDAPAPLCTLADLSSVWMVGDVYEKDLATLKTGVSAEVTLNAYPDKMWKGTVAAMSDIADPATRTLKVRVVLPNPGEQFKPEMFGMLKILRGISTSLLIPHSAVVHEGALASVFVQKSPGHFVRRTVALGHTVGDQVEVQSGLQSGESIVVEGALLLRNSALAD